MRVKDATLRYARRLRRGATQGAKGARPATSSRGYSGSERGTLGDFVAQLLSNRMDARPTRPGHEPLHCDEQREATRRRILWVTLGTAEGVETDHRTYSVFLDWLTLTVSP